MKINPEIKEKIITAATALVAEGIENPTNDQVRERMGGGSLTHISPVMREWRESRKAEVVAALEMPSDLKRVIETSVGQVWTAASKQASASVEAVRQKADAAVEMATIERDEALVEVRRLEERIAELQKGLAERDLTIHQLRGEFEEVRSQTTKLTSDNTVLMAQVKDKDETIKGLKAEIKEARNDNKALQGELVEIARKASKA